IIPTKNVERHLEEQLQAIFSQGDVPRAEVIIIDSGSTDGTLLVLERHPVKLISIKPEDFNHGATRNIGVRESEGEYLVFLTQDATPADDSWLKNLLKPLREDPAVAGVFSRHIPRSGCSLPLARQIEEEWPQAGGRERIVKQVSSREELEERKPHYVYFANTSSCLRRSVWERIPFRNVDFGEDVDWAERVLLAGYTIVYEPDSAVLHSHDYTLREQLRQHYDYGRMVRSANLTPAITARRSMKTFLVSLRDDLRYVRRKGLPIRRFLFSIPFHAYCVLGRWLGEHADSLPRWLQTSLSRQGAIKDQ
ncbi:MAG: glycosyltransferase family 2 protein, partial [bacterium]